MRKKFLKVLISSMLIASSVVAVNAETIKPVNPFGITVEEVVSEDLIVPYGITQDAEITGLSTTGGRGSAEYEHYGNFQYDARAYIQNIGETTFTYELYAPSGLLVYQGTLAKGKSVTLNLLQSVLQWNLSDGKGKVKIYTSDGSTCKAYFRYNVLD